MRRRTFLVSIGALAFAACDKGASTRPTPPPSAPPTLPTTTANTPTTTVAPTTTPAPTPASEPIGFPLDPAMRTGLVLGQVGARSLAWGEGPMVLAYSRDDQPSSDPVRANRSGWNARTHVEYEGQPAVDWYVPVGTPILATMDGTATLLINTVSNPFDVYAVSREPYIGSPDRARARISPFPGPGGGQGVFVRVVNDQFRTDYAHLEITQTVTAVPAAAFLPEYSRAVNFASTFALLRDFRTATAVASWPVRRGEVVGFTGDSGYSEAPHLHYAIRPANSENAFCPTTEPGFPNNGWLLR